MLQQEKIHLIAIFLILLLAVAVRLSFLFQPIRYDEAFTYLVYASKPLHLAFFQNYLPNNHLFHTLLVRTTTLLFGNQPWIIRLPALFAGTLLIPASYLTIRMLYNKHAAILTAAFVASSSILIEYSTLARGYTIICLIFPVIIGLGLYLKQNRNLLVWCLFTIISVLGFYTIPIMLYPFGIVMMWLFLHYIKKGRNKEQNIFIKDLLICSAGVTLLTMVLYTPVFMESGLKSVFANRFVTTQSFSYFFKEFPLSLSLVWQQWHRDIPVAVRFILLIGFFTSLFVHNKIARHRISIILPVIVFLLPVLVIQRVVPYPRVWLFLLPLYIGLSSAGIWYLIGLIKLGDTSAKIMIYTAFAIILSISTGLNVVYTQSVYYSEETGTLIDAEQITLFLKDYLQLGDRVFAVGPADFPLLYYFEKYNVPNNYLLSNTATADRILVITNTHEQTVEGVVHSTKTTKGILNMGEISLNKYSKPELVQRFMLASLYQLRRNSIKGKT